MVWAWVAPMPRWCRCPARVRCRFLVMKDGDMPKNYEPEFRARAVRLVRDHMSDYGSVTAASVAVGGQFGVDRQAEQADRLSWGVVARVSIRQHHRSGRPARPPVRSVRPLHGSQTTLPSVGGWGVCPDADADQRPDSNRSRTRSWMRSGPSAYSIPRTSPPTIPESAPRTLCAIVRLRVASGSARR